jgi:DNA-binding MarR family transcriptional regulator
VPARHHLVDEDRVSGLAALEREGLVVHTVVPSDRGPVRKVYRLTEAGRAALLAWLDLPADEVEVLDEQAIKVLCYGLLPPERALAQLRSARDLRRGIGAAKISIVAGAAQARQDLGRGLVGGRPCRARGCPGRVWV